MPRYFQESVIPQRTGFNSFDEMTHFVTKTKDEDWDHLRRLSLDYLQGVKIPPQKLKSSSLYKVLTLPKHHILPLMHHEIQNHYDQQDVGGGVIETVNTLGSELNHLLGIDWLAQQLGISPQHKVPRTLHSEHVAYLVDQTYLPVDERKNSTIGYTRLQQYDSDLYAVYQNDRSRELIVTVRGTKLSAGSGDLMADIQILLGKEPTSQRLDTMLTQLENDFPDTKYDIAAHSLGTMYVYGEWDKHREHMEDIFMFNPASSPTQGVDMLKEYGNDPHTWYFMNQGDIISHGVYQQMDDVTFDTQVSLGEYVYSASAAHSMKQWYPENVAASDDVFKQQQQWYEGLENLTPDSKLNQDTQETREANLS
jgi:hypothetical protein